MLRGAPPRPLFSISLGMACALLFGISPVMAQTDQSVPPLAHGEIGDRTYLDVAASGLKASIDLRQLPDCQGETLLDEGDSSRRGACRMAVLRLEDTTHPASTPYEIRLTPYSADGSDARDLQLDLRRLDAKAALPQAIVSVFTGGAHCCTLLSILGRTPEGANWTHTATPELSGEGPPLFTDVDGDGTPEIVTQDESFLYVFASHAGSWPPAIIYRYSGGRLIDVTRDAASRPWLETDLKRNEGFWQKEQSGNEPNGFLAYYVATKAELGQLSQAWDYMKAHQSHEEDPAFSVSLCTLIGRQDALCTQDERAPLPFPQGLAGFLVSRSYVTGDEMLKVAPDAEAAIRAATWYRPDFSCLNLPKKNGVAAMLCANSDAAQHELQFDQVYYALRQTVGPDGWKTLKQEVITAENDLDRECGLPIPGADDQSLPPNGAACYIEGMDRLTQTYRARLSGAALEESLRPLDRHIALQTRLMQLGYLPKVSPADGVYGESTRAAILAWKKDTGRPEDTAFLSDADAQALLPAPSTPAASTISPTETASPTAPETEASVASATTSHTLLGMSVGFALFILAIGTGIYLVPFFVACLRNTPRKLTVFLVNFFLGWTILGWVAALVLALSVETRPKTDAN